MTVSSQTNKSGPYNENGVTTNFAYQFSIRDAAHIKVVRALAGVETILALTADYTVTGVGNPSGGSVVIPVPATGSTLTLIRNVPFTQELDLENQGAYNAEDVEAAFDLATQRDQQLAEEIGRAVKVPVSTDASDLDTLIEGVIALLGAVDDIAIVAGISADVVTVAGIATQIETVSGISASIVTVAGIEADVSIVAAMAAQVGAVAAFEDEIIAVAGITTAVQIVANRDAEVLTVATNIASVNTAAANIAAINAAPAAAATATTKAAEAAASAASVNAAAIAQARFGNMFVNHNMRDSQEKGTALCTANGDFIADQWAQIFSLPGGSVSGQQITAVTKSGNDKQIEVKCLNTVALTSTQFYVLTQPIEASRLEYKAANWGTADAKPMVFRTERMLPAGLYHLKCSNYNETRNVTVPFTVVAGGVAGVIGDALGAVPPIVIPADTGGTWLRGDGQIGCTIDIVLAAGSSRVGGTAGVWGATPFLAATAQKNFFDSTANVGRVADLGIKPDLDGAGVYGQYEVGEVNAVYRSERYVKRGFASAYGYTASGGTSVVGVIEFATTMAKTPNVVGGAAGTRTNFGSSASTGASEFGFSYVVNSAVAGVTGAINDGYLANARLS